MFAYYLLFAAKTMTVMVAILMVFLGAVLIASKGKQQARERVKIKKLNEKYTELQRTFQKSLLTRTELKKLLKKEKKIQQEQEKAKSVTQEAGKRIFVLNFLGDVRASAVKLLREEITAILTVAVPTDEVVLCLESPGGMVHAYGLAASQLQRIRKQHIPLTIIVDKVAASGGYMMAAVANRILAAPFAIVGSIGVVAQLPNFNRLLKKNNIEFEQITAGQYKRTLTLFGENTYQGRQKFQQEVDEVHDLFKSFVLENRPLLNMETVATGEHWYGTQALAHHLIDGVMTSDDYLLAASKHADIYEISCRTKKTLVEKFSAKAKVGCDYLLEAFTHAKL